MSLLHNFYFTDGNDEFENLFDNLHRFAYGGVAYARAPFSFWNWKNAIASATASKMLIR